MGMGWRATCDLEVGRTFTVDGEAMCYGYIATTAPAARRSSASRCSSCRCHRQPNAGQPGSILFDGCDRCGCSAA